MSKKKKFTNNLTRLRKGTGLSQHDFAKRLGISTSLLKKMEDGKRELRPEISDRIFAETGIKLIPAPEETPLEYSKADHTAWQNEVRFDQKSIPIGCRVISKLIELMLSAGARPGVEKSYVLFNAMIRAIDGVKTEYGMEKHIDAELRDRQQTETKLYNVGELRINPILAKHVNFTDDPALKDEQQIPLARPIGWLPTREVFDLAWQHREFLLEMLKSQAEELTDEQKARLAEIEKQKDAVIDKYLPL
jgi:transcriptional regulator with XRE-family HTH domain